MKAASLAILILLGAYITVIAQNNPILIDEFDAISNDDLSSRVDNLWNQLKDGSQGVVILTGTTLANHLNKRRMEGCNLMRRYPTDSLVFIFENDHEDYAVQFWRIPPGAVGDSRFKAHELPYTLPHISRPFELTSSGASDDFCPRHFDLDWYARFLSANPSFKGKAVFDTSAPDFLKRTRKYREQLAALGIKTSRVRFFRRHFPHETDEQWWLIPNKKP